jgi:hypothetical protein
MMDPVHVYFFVVRQYGMTWDYDGWQMPKLQLVYVASGTETMSHHILRHSSGPNPAYTIQDIMKLQWWQNV